MPTVTSNAVRQLSDGSGAGTMMGQSIADPIRFFGAFGGTSGITQFNIVGSALGQASTAPVSTGGAVTTWSFATSTQANMMISTMVALWSMGLIG